MRFYFLITHQTSQEIEEFFYGYPLRIQKINTEIIHLRVDICKNLFFLKPMFSNHSCKSIKTSFCFLLVFLYLQISRFCMLTRTLDNALKQYFPHPEWRLNLLFLWHSDSDLKYRTP
jgi:hypothetical protein